LDNKKYIERTIELAKSGKGFVSPNPMVGCVITTNNMITSVGWHKKFGDNHAEVNAINNSNSKDFTNSTIYITLEPCTHYGKTPPCTDLIIKNKFKKVVFGVLDSNPEVAGKSINKLKNAGIEVQYGFCQSQINWLNRTFFKNIKKQSPYIISKFAQSIDGKIMSSTGKSKWITSKESRTKTHEYRAEFDAIMIGTITAKHDNPSLNVRLIQGRDPKRIILDKNLKLNSDLNLFSENNTNPELTHIIYNQNLADKTKEKIYLKRGIKLIDCPVDSKNKLNIKSILPTLYKKYNIGSIIVEGGAYLHSYFAENKLLDEFHIFIAPKIIGNGKSAFDNLYIDEIDEAISYETKDIQTLGNDTLIIATPIY